MRLKRTLDVTSDHCAKVYICQGEGPYDTPLRVQLADAEFIMGDIPVTADKITFAWDEADQTIRTFSMTQNSRISHISFAVDDLSGSDAYTVAVYVMYPNDTALYPIDITGAVLDSTTSEDLWIPPANSLVFPAGAAIVFTVTESGGGPYNGEITAYIVLAPAVV